MKETGVCINVDDSLQEFAERFVHELDRGELDGHLMAELERLSYNELLRVSQIMLNRARD
jgi:hypothetical protein